MCACPRSATAWASATTMRRADSRATSFSSLTMTSCAPPKRSWATGSSATDEPHGADESALEYAVEAGRVERLGDERRLVEWLEAGGAARDLRAVPIGGREKVVLLARDPGADSGTRANGLDIDANERARAAQRAVEGRAHRSQLDLDLAPPAAERAVEVFVITLVASQGPGDFPTQPRGEPTQVEGGLGNAQRACRPSHVNADAA